MRLEYPPSNNETPKEPFDYDPVEGIDYLVDLYSVSGVERNSSTDDIKIAINKRLLEYHPDRLQGLAPEFNETGERTVLLLNRARHILLDEARRTQYDELLSAWTGPISEKGVPVITMGRWQEMKFSQMTADEIEADFHVKRLQIEELTGYKSGRLDRMESLAKRMGDQPDPDISLELEDALFQYDRVLSIEQAERMQLFGIDTKGNDYRVSLESPTLVAGQLETAMQVLSEDREQISQMASKLALLSGDYVEKEAQIVPADSSSVSELPIYLNDQSKKILELAELRREILKKRLDILEPSYPYPKLQTKIQPKIMLGIEQSDGVEWLTLSYEYDEKNSHASVNIFDRDEHLSELLDSESYPEIIEAGFMVATIKIPENIDVMTVVNQTIAKILKKFGIS